MPGLSFRPIFIPEAHQLQQCAILQIKLPSGSGVRRISPPPQPLRHSVSRPQLPLTGRGSGSVAPGVVCEGAGRVAAEEELLGLGVDCELDG
mmetsp:Transcript_24906/g.59178  ORF Transcript_24906/g.59178 Transcript_24906/m.59178 type:complete len:92 (+) Transcript_24906:32-307(+)